MRDSDHLLQTGSTNGYQWLVSTDNLLAFVGDVLDLYCKSVPDVTWQRPDGKYAPWMEQAHDWKRRTPPISRIERWSEFKSTVSRSCVTT